MAEEIVRKKVSELPVASTLSGLYTLGVNSLNQSVKVSLEFVNTAATAASEAAGSANTAAQAANTAAANTNTAIATANQAAQVANEAAVDADNAALVATTAAGNAVSAASSANNAASSANSAATAAGNAATTASEAADNANTAADEVRAEVTDIRQFVYSRNLYGVEFLKGVSDPAAIRWIGDEKFKTNNLILNKFKVAKVKDGKVTGYLKQNNFFLMEDGTPSGIVIDGETFTDDGSDIMLVNTEGFWVINGGTHETFERRLVSDSPFSFDNDNAVYVKPFGMSIDYSIIKDGVQRSIRDNTHSGIGSSGIGGISYLEDGKGCPTTYVSRFGYEGYARAKNTDNTKNVPYANVFQFDLNVWATLLFIQFQTKDIHSNNLLGGCISSNDAAPTGSTWGTTTGVRVLESGGGYSYYNISSSRFMNQQGGSSYNFWQLLNNSRPLLKMFDAQLALSYAAANSIAPDTEFNFDGFKWTYTNVPGVPGIADGEMTARIRKFVTVSFTGYDNIAGADVENKILDYCLDQAIVKGKVPGWGNLYTWVSGVDCVVDGGNNNVYSIYQTDDVEKLTIDSDNTDKNPGEIFTFEERYEKVGDVSNGSGYRIRHFDNSMMGNTPGASLHSGECAYNYYSSSASAGKRSRRGVRFGGYATISNCSLRYAYANNAPAAANSSIGGGFRVSLT